MRQLLLIDSDDARRDRLAAALRERDFRVEARATSAEPSLEGVDVVLLALEPDTPARVEALRRADALVPSVVYSRRPPDPEVVLALGRARVHDCVVIPDGQPDDELLLRLRGAADRQEIRRRELPIAEDLLGTSQKIAQVRRYIYKAAQSDANVLILGESGTGKELVARAIHAHGQRRDAPFLAVNCSAIPDQLLESELFGHEKGSFTGASGRTRGLFEQAEGGTLFFDEIGDMPSALQAKLLRVLQPPPGASETTRELRRVGSEDVVRSDVRVVFATHRDLQRDVKAGRFREDLFQRIHVLGIRVPPLRERREDVPLLARHFLERYGEVEGHPDLRFDPLVMDVLQSYDFPLNVRELEGIVRSLVILKEAGTTVVLGDLPPQIFGVETAEEAEATREKLMTLAEVERRHVQRVMEEVGGNKSRAARILGISRPALDRKLARQEGSVPPSALQDP